MGNLCSDFTTENAIVEPNADGRLDDDASLLLTTDEWPLKWQRRLLPVPRDGYSKYSSDDHFTGIGVAWSTATAVTLFCGDPSTTRSEYVR